MAKTYSHALLAALLASGCTSFSPTEISAIKTVGIENQFPAIPAYTIVGTTVFNNELADIGDSSLHAYVGESLARLLEAKGYKVIQDTSHGSYPDLVILINPRDIYGMVYTKGYGIYQRSFLGAVSMVTTYVALNLHPMKGGASACTTCYGKSLKKIPLDRLPSRWTDLDEAKRTEILELLKKSIDEALREALSSTKL